jgi:Protein of unknown function (DUF1194)
LRRVSFALAAVCFSTAAAAHEKSAVDLALILAVDCSGSVDREEFQLQLDGIAAAFRDPAVIAAIGAGRYGRIAVNMMLWADPDEQKLTSGWAEIGNAREANAFAGMAETFDTRIGGGTGLGIAIGYGVSLLKGIDFHATRKLIDVSGDGRESWELREPRFRLPQAKALRATTNITVNGLAISNNERELPAYYRENVIGGPGSFVIEAKTYGDFAKAMRIKLLREILPDVAMRN